MTTYYYYVEDHIKQNQIGYDDPLPQEISESVEKELSNKKGIDFFCGNATVSGDSGYYDLAVGLTPDGLEIYTTFYEEDEDGQDW